MSTIKNDLFFGLRMLRKSPGLMFAVVVALALGVGANTAMFSIVSALILRPLPVPAPEQIVVLASREGRGGIGSQFSVPEYRDIASQTAATFSGVFGYRLGIDGIHWNGRTDRIVTNYVTSNFFSTLRVKPLIGSLIVSGQGEQPNSDPVIVLSYEYWRKVFNSDESIIGKKVLVDGKPVNVIGVTAKEFHGVLAFLNTQAYLPLGMVTLEGESRDFMQNRALRNMSVGARLVPGRTTREATAVLAIVAHRMTEQYHEAGKSIQLMVFPELRARPNPDPSNSILWISGLFLSLAIVLLLLACLNVTNVLLIRATARESEMAIRTALGASRSALIRQLLIESLLLAAVGAIAGTGVGRLIIYVMSHIDLHTQNLVRLDFEFDWRVFAYALAATVLIGVFIGLAPAVRVSRTDVNTLLRHTGRGVLRGKHRLRSSLVVAQVAGSLLLLILAGLFLRSFKVAQSIDLGFDPHQVVSISMDPGEVGYNDLRGLAFYETLLERVQSLPGVDQAALTSSIPLSYYNDADSVRVTGFVPGPGQSIPHAMFSAVSAGYLDTMRIPLLRGRNFDHSDNANSPYVAIINQTMAERYWPNQDPLGQRFVMGREPKHSIEVVGLARNSRIAGVTGTIGPNFYVPLEQHYSGGLASLQTLVVRVSGHPAAALPELQKLISSLAPGLPMFDAQTMQNAINTLNGLLIFQVGAALAGALGCLGLVLSVIGLYGLISYSVGQRTQEIGIRMAIGAQPSSVMVMLLKEGMLLVGVGLIFGIVCALAAGRMIASFLVVSPRDPLTYGVVAGLLTVVSLAACYVPARRIMHMEPIRSLKYE